MRVLSARSPVVPPLLSSLFFSLTLSSSLSSLLSPLSFLSSFLLHLTTKLSQQHIPTAQVPARTTSVQKEAQAPEDCDKMLNEENRKKNNCNKNITCNYHRFFCQRVSFVFSFANFSGSPKSCSNAFLLCFVYVVHLTYLSRAMLVCTLVSISFPVVPKRTISCTLMCM